MEIGPEKNSGLSLKKILFSFSLNVKFQLKSCQLFEMMYTYAGFLLKAMYDHNKIAPCGIIKVFSIELNSLV